MKKNVKKLLPIMCLILVYALLALACASSPAPTPPPEQKYAINIDNINEWLKNYEVKIPAGNGLTSEQLMAVTKLCIESGELQNFTIAEQNQLLSFAYIRSSVAINGKEMNFRYSYAISKQGILSMRIQSVTEVIPGSYEVIVRKSELESYRNSVIQKFVNKITNSANIVIERSKDFA